MMIRVYEAAADLQAVCVKESWAFCFIGGIAVLRWSDPRMTEDADITLFTGFGGEEKFIDILLSNFAARAANARELALHARMILFRRGNGVPLCVALGGSPFEKRTIERSSMWNAGDYELRTCSHKAFDSRGLDWMDVERIIQRQGEKLDTHGVRP